MLFKVTDDSGFLAIIDPDAYRGFVHADWTWDTIQEHFRREMRDRHLLIWGTGMEHFWSIDVSFQPTRASGFREVVGSIGASRGRLLLTNYESLTMAAQFPDVTLPEAHERGQVLSVSPGLYDCRIVQLSDPKSGAPFEEPVSFIYEFTRATSSREVWRERGLTTRRGEPGHITLTQKSHRMMSMPANLRFEGTRREVPSGFASAPQPQSVRPL